MNYCDIIAGFIAASIRTTCSNNCKIIVGAGVVWPRADLSRARMKKLLS